MAIPVYPQTVAAGIGISTNTTGNTSVGSNNYHMAQSNKPLFMEYAWSPTTEEWTLSFAVDNDSRVYIGQLMRSRHGNTPLSGKREYTDKFAAASMDAFMERVKVEMVKMKLKD